MRLRLLQICSLQTPRTPEALLSRKPHSRALDGDAVAVELLPEAQWRAPSRVLPSVAAREQAPEAAGAEDDADAEPDGGHIAQVPRP